MFVLARAGVIEASCPANPGDTFARYFGLDDRDRDMVGRVLDGILGPDGKGDPEISYEGYPREIWYDDADTPVALKQPPGCKDPKRPILGAEFNNVDDTDAEGVLRHYYWLVSSAQVIGG